MAFTGTSTTACGLTEEVRPTTRRSGEREASADDRPADVRLGQYYTKPEVAVDCLQILREHVDPAGFQMVEPSAGDGAFFRLLPPDSLGYDLDPKFPGVQQVDFLSVELRSDRAICFVGNPPFGRNASEAVRFFNHAARTASVIAFIVPRSFRKASIENRLNQSFHLVREELLHSHSFLFRGKAYDVPATFQIWKRRPEARPLRPTEIRHPDFAFTTPDLAHFAIQRVGARAGRVHQDMKMARSSHYFIRGRVKSIMRRLNFASVTVNVAGNPSLSKSEIIALYRARTEP